MAVCRFQRFSSTGGAAFSLGAAVCKRGILGDGQFRRVDIGGPPFLYSSEWKYLILIHPARP